MSTTNRRSCLLNRLAMAASVWVLLIGASAAVTPAEPELLPPEQAFEMSLTARGDVLRLNLQVAQGYYLYRDRIALESLQASLRLDDALMPPGKLKHDPLFGEVQVYRGTQVIEIPILAAPAAGDLRLRVRSQGCADLGICFPPQSRELQVRVATSPSALTPLAALMAETPQTPAASPPMSSPAGASGALQQLVGAAPEFLPPEQAFRPRLAQDADGILRVSFDIAKGYYLYRSKLAVVPAAHSPGLSLGDARLPPGKRKRDDYLGDVEVYYRVLDASVPVLAATANEATVLVRHQGCADAGLCYPPQESEFTLVLTAAGAGVGPAAGVATLSETDRLAQTVLTGHLGLVVASFFVAGLLLAFTPCVLPMVPILSSIIVGDRSASARARGFALSMVYVLAMSLTYTGAGVAAGLFGQNLQALFQHPAVLVGFAGVFVVLGLAMLGVYQLQLPGRCQSWLSQLGHRGGGRLGGVATMGALSALIVGPCVAAPLAAALIVIGSSGDPLRGGIALFALSLGMGAPLVVFGTFGAGLLPRAGAWMNLVKQFFGLLLFAVAIYLVSRIVPEPATLALWALLAALASVLVFVASRDAQRGPRLLSRAASLAGMAYAVALGVGSASGAHDPFQPLAVLRDDHRAALQFTRVKSVNELDHLLAGAASEGRLVMLDYYADWCVSCKEMERETFSDRRIHTALGDALLLQSDVTGYNEDDQALLQRFGLYGPPAILFFGPDGSERRDRRVIGFMDAASFEQHVNAITPEVPG